MAGCRGLHRSRKMLIGVSLTALTRSNTLRHSGTQQTTQSTMPNRVVGDVDASAFDRSAGLGRCR